LFVFRHGKRNAMQGSIDRILTTHVGSLPRTLPVLDAMKARFDSDTFDDEAYQAEIISGVNEIVKRQADLGIDIVTDGEMSKPDFMSYVEERIEGFEARRMKNTGCIPLRSKRFRNITPTTWNERCTAPLLPSSIRSIALGQFPTKVRRR
jgi:methionine synthase II (cobalamin-independent)